MKTKINRIVKDLCFLDNDPKANNKLKDDLGIDSLKLVELIVLIEEDLNICLDDADLNPSNIKTVEDLYKLVSKYTDEDAVYAVESY